MKLAFKRALAAIMLGLSFAAPAAAAPFEDAIAAYDKGDYATALQLLRPLADRELPMAQHNLGVMYENGLGVTQNYAEAVKWYRKAADQGFASAQLNLGFMYENGLGITQNDAEAVKWYRKASDQGNAIAQSNLGFMYENGLGVPQDYVSAHMWLNLSAAQGNQAAAEDRDKVARLMTPAQLAKAQKLAREWKPTTPSPR